jgi:ATP-binding cassette subfamily F protein 3
MFELLVTGLKKYMDSTLVLKNITFQAYAGEKVGIIGANGCGKSTLLRLIAGIEPMNYWPGYPQTSSFGYDEGFISIPEKATIAYLEQIPRYGDDMRVMDVLNMAFDEVRGIEREMRKLETEMKALHGSELDKALKRYSDLAVQFEVKGGYSIDEKLSRICTGLNFEEPFLNKKFNLLSGGEKTTVVLGKILMDNPDILLLDEPTNHLDMSAIEWLEGYINSYRGIVLIVSHDRYFLDNTVKKIVEIEDMEAIAYKGNYSAYARQKEENLRIQYENYLEQQKKIHSMEKAIKELRDWAYRADNNKFFRRAASMQIKLDKMARVERPVFEKQNMKVDLKIPQRSGYETIKADALSKSFGEKILFKNAQLLIRYGERAALIGPNGSGKTTFLKMLLGEEAPDSGTVETGANAMTAYLPQRIVFNNEELTVLECFREDISILEGKAREYLSKYMFYGNSVFKKVRQLSGGEKIRLKLAKLLYAPVNLLILDEPTNHLDIDSIETIEEALEQFDGTIFFISHDRYFINKIGQRVIAIEDYALKSYQGNYDDYKKQIQLKTPETPKDPLADHPKGDRPVNLELARRAENTEKERRQKELEAKRLEQAVKDLENEIMRIDLAMASNPSDYNELDKLYCRKESLNRELDAALARWLELGS